MKRIIMDKIAVLIPCFNESTTIEKVVNDFKIALPDSVIYVYDNNSTDGTADIAAKAGAIVRREYRQGKGNVIRSMFRDIDAECNGIDERTDFQKMIDGDDTYPAKDAKKMCDLVLNKGVDMVIGDRLSSTYFAENKRPFHNLGNRMVRSIINWLFGSNVRDIMTGYRAFSYQFVKNFPVLSKGFEIETEMTIHALDKNFLLEEIVVNYKDRPEGSVSKLNTYLDGIKVLTTIARLFRDYKPFAFFGCWALLIAIIALALFIPVLLEYFDSGLVPRFPTLIVSTVLGMMALMLWASGIILEVIAKKHRQLYELLMNK